MSQQDKAVEQYYERNVPILFWFHLDEKESFIHDQVCFYYSAASSLFTCTTRIFRQ